MKKILTLLIPFILFLSCSNGRPGFTVPLGVVPTNDNPTNTESTNYVDSESDTAAINKYNAEGKTLIWSDEFNESSINTQKWNYDLYGNNGYWGTTEIQWHTDRPENSYTENGTLVIKAIAESYAGRSYTAARLHTHGKGSWQYGRIEASIKMPANDIGVTDAGIWPAFWMLGDNFSGWSHNTLYGGNTGWPHCGEIDIMEVGGATGLSTLYGTIHYQDNVGYEHTGDTTNISDMYSSFHTYGIEWTTTNISWTIDGSLYYEKDITPAYLSEFHKKFFILFNFAIDGYMGGTPNPANYPQYLYIDWVRIYQ